MEQRIGMINIEIKKLADQAKKLSDIFSQENFGYNILESQFEQLRMRNARLQQENDLAQTQIKNALDAADKVRKDAGDFEQSTKAAAMVLYQKVQVKLKEVEGILQKAEKRQITIHLNEVEKALGATETAAA